MGNNNDFFDFGNLDDWDVDSGEQWQNIPKHNQNSKNTVNHNRVTPKNPNINTNQGTRRPNNQSNNPRRPSSDQYNNQPESYNPYNNSYHNPYTNPVTNINNPYTPNKSTNKLMVVIIIVLCIAASIILGVTAIKFLLGGFNSSKSTYISAATPTNISGMTLDELSQYSLSVTKGSKSCDIEETDWYMNNVLIQENSSIYNIDISKLSWGNNYIKAVNGNGKEGDKLKETQITFTINLERNLDSEGELHRIQSALNKLPNTVLDKMETTQISELSEDNISSINAFKENKDGSYRYTFSEGNIIIQLDQTTPLQFVVDTTSRFNQSYVYQQFTIEFDESSTIAAKATINLDQSTSPAVYHVLKYVDGVLSEVESPVCSDSQVIFMIYDSGTYFISRKSLQDIQQSSKYVNIFIVDTYNTGSIGDWNESLELGVNTTEEEQLTSIYDDKYKSVVEIIAKELHEIDSTIKVNIYSYNQYMIEELYDAGTKNETRTVYQLGDAKLLPYLYNRLENTGYYLYKNTVVILNNSDASITGNSTLVTKLNKLEELLDRYNSAVIYSVNSKDTNLNTFINSDELKCVDVKTFSQILNAGEYITSPFKIDKSIYLECGEDFSEKVLTLASSGFEFGEDNISSKVGYNVNSNLTNAYGQCLLVDKSFNQTITAEDFSTIDYDSIKSSEMPESTGYTGGLRLNLSYDKIEILNESQLTTLNYDCSNLVSILNDEIHSVTHPEYITNFEEGFETNLSNLITKLKSGNNQFAILKSSKGSTTVLITDVYTNARHTGTYYLGVYDPLNPTEQQIITLKTFNGVTETGAVKTGYKLSYTQAEYEFDSLYIYTS